MNFFKKIGRAIGPTVTMGMWKPGQKGGGGGSAGEELVKGQKGISKQAGGGQINYTTEEMMPASQAAKKPAPVAAAPARSTDDRPDRSGRYQQAMDRFRDLAKKYSSGTSTRSEAAKKMLEEGNTGSA